MSELVIIGVDCATQPSNTGLALCRLDADRVQVIAVQCGAAADVIPSWIKGRKRALLAFDVPLGWPIALAPALLGHRAGELLPGTADRLFHRYTDDAVRRRLSLPRAPMEVGADRIARAAHATLQVIAKLRETIEAPLAWSPDWDTGVRLIEVYPTATRYSLGRYPLGVRPVGGTLDGLDHRYEFAPGVSPRTEHERDAVVCAIAGLEFIRDRAVAPSSAEEIDLARREGWIWVGDSPKYR